MARRRWFMRPWGVESVAPAEQVEQPPDPGAGVAWPVGPPSWNEHTTLFEQSLTPAAAWRARQASWRWPE